jgi:ABC-type cobalamin/Fe3+-siderophores transport system ATPase subunit
MISEFRLKFGNATGAAANAVATTPIVVFVGPNNSGKSKVLKEIERYCREGHRDSLSVVLDELKFVGLSQAEAELAIEHFRQQPKAGEAMSEGHVIVGARGARHQVSRQALSGAIQNPASHVAGFCQWFLSLNTLMLDGPSRIGLVSHSGAGDLQVEPQTALQVLFRDDSKRQNLRRIINEAFGNYFVVDPTLLGQLRIRFSERPPVSEIEERGIHKEAVEFHAKALSVDHMSDGVKAFTGIMLQVIAGDPRVILIDEPEAFLHPSLASKLGREISDAAQSSDKRVFVSTHSPAFVMGCIQSGAPVTIVRLTYRSGVPTARVLPGPEILKLMRNPLLRSTGVLSGLFYEFVVVTESDADRAFYQEVNERLLKFKPEWGIPNCLFINAQNKQTVQTIIRPLREMGIPAAGIVDVDVIKDGGTSWTSILMSAGISQLAHQSLGALRAAIKQAMEATGKDMKTQGGISILGDNDNLAASDLLAQLADYGIFVVPSGELECWLKELGAAGHGPGWLIDMFERMGEDPASATYMRPKVDDVWEFISKLKGWLTNPSRKGIPT